MDFRDQMLLRILAGQAIPVKGAQLTWQELDLNQALIAGAVAVLYQAANVAGLVAYDPAFTYIGGQTYFRSFDGNVWKFKSPTSQTGITPGTNPAVWELSSSGLFAHIQGTDNQLLRTGGIVLTADDIFAGLGGGGGSFSIVPQVVSAAGTAIPAAISGIKQAILQVAAETTYTGLPVASGSGKVFSLLQNVDFPARFNRAIGNTPAGEILLPGIDSAIMFYDSAVGVYTKLA